MTKKNKENLNIKKRPPVVVVLGHIDHGKTSLLMAIKDFRVLGKEGGGITQHVGAYQIEYNKEKITFIDTPGHESFSGIRSRGIRVADIAILVIDACEGIKKQTKEAISQIKESGLSLIVALNKMDKNCANPEKVKQELLEEDIFVESLGGKIPSVNVSAKTKEGIDDLLEMILLLAEVEDLKGDFEKKGEGVVIESRLDARKGGTATVIVIDGKIKAGDYIGTDSTFGKIKILESFDFKTIESADPSSPVLISGFDKVPLVSEVIKVYDSLSLAKENIKTKKNLIQKGLIDKGDKVLNLIIKADVIGSLEGILELLKNIPQDKVSINILKAEIGDINEKDVKMARTSDAELISFGVKTDKIAESIIQNTKMNVHYFNIIYDLAKKVRELMDALLVVQKQRIDVGELDVLAIFRTEKSKQIVGGKVIFGKIERGLKVEIFRDNEKIGEGKVTQLEAAKKKVNVVHKDNEAGMVYEGKEKIQEGDILRFFKEEFVKPTIDV